MPPAAAVACLAALDLVRKGDAMRTHLHSLIGQFRAGAQRLGLPLGPSATAIQPIILGESQACHGLVGGLTQARHSSSRNQAADCPPRRRSAAGDAKCRPSGRARRSIDRSPGGASIQVMSSQLARLDPSPPATLKPKLVLLHGWGMDRSIWRDLLPLLNPYFELFVPDLPGYGDQLSKVFPEDIATLAGAIMNRLPARAAYLGWSLGGSIATWIAGHVPARVSTLVTAACNPCFVRRPEWQTAMSMADFTAFRRRVEGDPDAGRRYFKGLQVHNDQRERLVLRQMHMLSTSPVSRRTLLSGLELLQALDLRDEWAGLRQPVLAVLGERDTLVPEQLGSRLAEKNERATVWNVTGAAHVPFLSSPGAFASRVTDFLIQHDSPMPAPRPHFAVARSFNRADDYDQAASLQREVGLALIGRLPRKKTPASCGSRLWHGTAIAEAKGYVR